MPVNFIITLREVISIFLAKYWFPTLIDVMMERHMMECCGRCLLASCSSPFLNKILFLKYSFIFESTWVGDGRRVEQRISVKLSADSRKPNVGFKRMNQEIMTWPEVRSSTDNWATWGTLPSLFLKYSMSRSLEDFPAAHTSLSHFEGI